MSTPFVSPRGIVVSIWGKAYIRGADGAWRPLKVGEVVKPSDQLLTEQNAIVQMEPPELKLQPTGGVAAEGVDRAIAALGTREGAPAAGLAGGEGGDLQPGLRVERIVESLTPVALVSGSDAAAPTFGRAAASTGAPELDSPTPVAAGSASISAVEAGGAVGLGLAAPTGGGTLTVSVTQVPAIGQVVTAGGAVVAAATVLTPADVAGLRYLPPTDYDGSAPVGAFAYTVSNGSSSATGSVQIAVTAVNDAPLATAGAATGDEDGTLGVSLAGTDVDGTIASVRVTTLPANGALLLADGATPVAADQALTPAQAASLIFKPNADFNGSTTLAFTVTDNDGAVSSPAAVALTVTPVNDAPVAVADAVSTVATAPVTRAVLANDRDVDGDLLRVTGASVPAAQGTVVVDADGRLTFTAAPGVSGDVVVNYTIADPSGATATAAMTISVAAALALTVDGPALTKDSTPLVSGTSNAPPGSTVALTVTGADGAAQTFSATVQPDGSYGASVPNALVDGAYSVAATINVGGSSAFDNDGGSIDTTAPAITVDAPILGNDSTPTITGTTDLPPGSTVTLTVTGANGAVQTFSATVQAGGTYGADVPAALADGNFVVVATGSDAAGNTGSDSAAGAIDTAKPALTLAIDPVTADNLVTTPEAAGTIVVTGTAGGEAQVGDIVTLVVNGNTYAGAVQAGGTFSIAVAGADLLADADRRIDASISSTDAAGNSATQGAQRTYAVNNAPVAVADAIGVSEDDPAAAADVTPGTPGQDVDGDGDPLVVVGVAAGAVGTASGNVGTAVAGSFGSLVLNADGSYSYAPGAAAQALAPGQSAGDVFTYTIGDGRGAFATTTLTVTVQGANDVPVAGNVNAATGENSVLASSVPAASDVDGSITGYALVAGPASGTLTFNSDGTYSFSPGTAFDDLAAGATRQVTFSYTATDNDGGVSVPATVTITVMGTNDAPVASDAAASTGENSVLASSVAVASDIDGTIASYALVAGPASGALTFNSDGTYSFNPGTAFDDLAVGATRQVSFAYTATDNDGSVSAPATVTITVTGTNDTPVASNASAGTGENAVLASSVPAASDVDGTIASYALVAGPASGALTFNTDGTYSFNPGTDFDNLAPGATRQVSFTYTATDNDGGVSAPATVTINVTGTNDAPVASDANASTSENSVLASNVPAASDVDGTIAGYSLVTGPASGALTFTSDGTYSFNPGAAFDDLAVGATRQVSFTYTATDNDGATSAPATVTITVTGTNDTPVAMADTASTPINTPLDNIAVLANDSDPDAGTVLQVTGASVAATSGTVSVNPDGTINFTPASNVTGPVLISYTLSDGITTTTGTLTVTVGPNTPPAGADKTLSTDEDTGLTFAAADFGFSDADLGQSLAAVRIDSLPAGGTLLLGGSPVSTGQLIAAASLGTLVFTPAANANGTAYASFTFSVQDSAGGFDPAPNTITIDVTPVADPAVVGGAATGSVTEDGTLVTSGTLTVTDPDAGEAAFQAASATTANGTFAITAGGAWTFTLDNAAVQSMTATETRNETFTVFTVDGTAQVVSLTIQGSNDVPTVTASSASATEGASTVTGSVSGSDADSGETATLAYAVSGAAPAGFTLNPDGSWTFDPTDATYNGLKAGQTQTLTIPFVATDAQGAVSAAANLTITVTGTNDAPVASNDGTVALPVVSVAEDSGASAPIPVLANDSDPDGDALSVTAASSPDGSVTVNADNTLSFTPASNFSGATTISYTVSDGNGGSATATVFVNVAPVNDAPVNTVPTSIAVTEDVATALTGIGVADVDAGGSAVTVTLAVPAGTLAAASGGGVTVGGTSGALTLSGSVANINAFIAGSNVTYTTAPNANGSVTLTVTTSDGGNTGSGGTLSDTDTVTLAITAVNDVPDTDNVSASGAEDPAARVAVNLSGSDIDGTIASFTITGLPANGALYAASSGGAPLAAGAVVTGPVYFVPNADFNGTTSFQYAATDNSGATDATPATATITIAAVNDAPLNSLPASLAATEDTTLAITGLSVADVDAASGPMTVTLTVTHGTLTVSGGSAAIAGNGSASVSLTGTLAAINATLAASVNFVPSANYNGSATLTMVSSDNGNTGSGGALGDSDSITFDVAAVNDAPISAADSATRVEGGSTSGFTSVLANDSDIELSPLTVGQVATAAGGSAVTVNGISTVTTALGGTVVMNADGTFRYIAPAVAHDASNTPVADSFVYRASDGTDLGAWTTVTLNLSDTTPTAANDSANVVFNGTVSGNLLVNDGSVDALRVSSFTFGSTSVAVPSGGSNSIDTAGGLLTVSSDGSYTYTSQLPGVKVLTGSSLATWENSTNLYGYTSGSAFNGSGNLVLGNLNATLQNNTTFVNGSKNGIGVSGNGATLGNGETLVIDMLETTTFVTIGIAQLNTNQSPSNAIWKAFGADGTLVASGDFSGATPISSGTEYTLNISNSTPFEYVTLQWTNTSNGFVLSSIDLTRNPSNYVETFSYTATDADGDTSSANFTVTPAISGSSGSTTITGSAGDDTYIGTVAAETFNAGSGHDVVRAGGGADALNGGDGNDYLDGGAGNDVIDGGAGNDILIGGGGNDVMTGGAGADVFAWRLGDTGNDTITSFNAAAATSGGDVLDLRDLLAGETTTASLDDYLNFTLLGSNTVISVKPSGAGGTADQTITLSGVTLDTALGLSPGATDAQIIAELISRGKLLTDVPPGG